MPPVRDIPVNEEAGRIHHEGRDDASLGLTSGQIPTVLEERSTMGPIPWDRLLLGSKAGVLLRRSPALDIRS